MSRRRASKKPIRRTASQIARDPGPEPVLGEYLWERTNQLVFGWPIETCSGRLHDDVYQTRGRKCFLRRYSAPRNPDQPGQIEQQDRVRVVMPAWSVLPAEDRQGWLDYAIKHYGEFQPGKKRGNLGQNAHTSASLNLLSRGEPLLGAPPVHAPPRPVIQVVEVPAPAGQIAWRVEHGQSDLEGHLLEIEMTPEAPGDQQPRKSKLTRAGLTSAGSFLPLRKSGEHYVLDQPRHAVKPGRRYGLQVRICSPEGVEGPALFLNLERKAPGELPPGSLVETGGDARAGLEAAIAGAVPGAGTAAPGILGVMGAVGETEVMEPATGGAGGSKRGLESGKSPPGQAGNSSPPGPG